MKLGREQKLNNFAFFLGLSAVLFMVVPFAVLGENSVVVYHDQLDGELIAYVLRARHLFCGNMLPEFMGGTYKTALIPPAPAAVLLFKIFTPFTALAIMQLAGSVVGYLGMYGLVKNITGKSIIAAPIGVMYGYLPFLPVYGLTQYGIPLLIWAVWRLDDRADTTNTIFASVCFAIYSLNSSLVLAGFGILGCTVIWILVMYIRKKRKSAQCLVIPFVIMILIYCAENLSLILQTLGLSDTYVSHKTEYTLVPESLNKALINALLYNGQHSEDYHILFAGFLAVEVFLGVLFYIIFKKTAIMGKKYMCIFICLAVIIAFCLITALWNSGFGMGMRTAIGALGAFQMDRLLWISPALWYLMLACGLGILWDAGNAFGRISKYTRAAAVCVCCVIVTVCGGYILLNSPIKQNLMKIIKQDYDVIDFNDYYATGVMDKAEKLIYESSGKKMDEYKVVSLGVDPAAALYHGFYCLDGYSNNYPLNYKHAFRNILKPELEKSSYLSDYFDGWGNRCYLFSSECPGYYTIEKGGFYFQNYDIDTEALKEMGGEFILSAAYILDADKKGLTLLNETALDTDDSYYQLYVYEVN